MRGECAQGARGQAGPRQRGWGHIRALSQRQQTQVGPRQIPHSRPLRWGPAGVVSGLVRVLFGVQTAHPDCSHLALALPWAQISGSQGRPTLERHSCLLAAA